MFSIQKLLGKNKQLNFNLVHLIPNNKLHIFHGLKEVIETIQWGLNSIGYDASYEVNSFRQDAVNIIFGAQMMSISMLEGLPRNSIIYNLEQMAGLRPEEVRESYQYCARNFEIWDYSEFNLDTWKTLDSDCHVKFLPISYAPILTRIPQVEQDIDVLFYGGLGGRRLEVFQAVCQKLLKTVFVHGLYGVARDELIARSKIVLNINQYPDSQVFEMARVSYLLANKKAVISDISPSSKIEDGLMNAIKFVPVEAVADECELLVENIQLRQKLEQTGFEEICKRDIKKVLTKVIQ